MIPIPVDMLEPNPNRWVVLTQHRLLHPTYGVAVGSVAGGEPRTPHDSLEAAMAEAESLLARAAEPLAPAAVRQTELVSVSVRAYRDPDVQFRPMPLLTEAEWQGAWDNGPGAEA